MAADDAQPKLSRLPGLRGGLITRFYGDPRLTEANRMDRCANNRYLLLCHKSLLRASQTFFFTFLLPIFPSLVHLPDGLLCVCLYILYFRLMRLRITI